METICLNLLEATVTLYPARLDGSPITSSPIYTGAPAENLRGIERWLKREVAGSGAKYPRKHPLVAQYDVSIGRVWALPEDAPTDWQASYQQYVLDIIWVEEETQQWHRKTFYGVTISQHTWEAADVEKGFMENQEFEAQYMVVASGTNYAAPPIIPATLPYRVLYTDANDTVLLYTYDPNTRIFTAQASTTGRAVITNTPFAVTFDGDAQPVVFAVIGAPKVYRTSAHYRTSASYRNLSGLIVIPEATSGVDGISASPPPASALPRLDFYYGEQRLFSVTRDGLFETDFIEGSPALPAAGAYAANAGNGTLMAVFTGGRVTASNLQVIDT